MMELIALGAVSVALPVALGVASYILTERDLRANWTRANGNLRNYPARWYGGLLHLLRQHQGA